MNFEHVSDSVDCIDMQVEWRESEGYVNKEVCVNIELFLLVFVHGKKKSASCIRSSRMNVLWFLMDFCQVSYRCGLLKVGKYDGNFSQHPV